MFLAVNLSSKREGRVKAATAYIAPISKTVESINCILSVDYIFSSTSTLVQEIAMMLTSRQMIIPKAINSKG